MIDLLLVDLPLRLNYVAPLNLAILKSIATSMGLNAKCIDLSHKYNSKYYEILWEALRQEVNKYCSAFRTVSKVVYSVEKLSESRELEELAEEIANEINRYGARVVGITTRADSVYLAVKVAQLVNARVILGGPGVLFSHEYLKKYPGINAIFVGDAEDTLPIYLPDIVNFSESYSTILPLRPYDFSRLIIPDYSDFDLSKYRLIGIETQRGCINKCKYCSARYYPYGPVRLKPIEHIDRELEVLKQWGKDFFLCDNISNVSKHRMIEICKVFYKHGCKFHAELVPDIDEELAEWLSKVAVKITLGIESLSNGTIRLMGRPYTWDKIKRSLLALKKYNVPVHGMFIFGFPKSSLAGCVLTLLRLLKYGDLFSSVALGSYILTYGSYVHKHHEEYGIKILREGEQEAILNCLPFKQGRWEEFKNKVKKFLVDIVENYFLMQGKVYYWRI